VSRFLYLNIYSFLTVVAGILALIAPFYMISKWTLILQAIAAVKLFIISGKLFSTWEYKKREIDFLTKKNQRELRPDSFDVFMQAPCGRLVVRQVLRDLNRQNEYKSLKKLQKPLWQQLQDNCLPDKTVIYINKEFV